MKNRIFLTTGIIGLALTLFACGAEENPSAVNPPPPNPPENPTPVAPVDNSAPPTSGSNSSANPTPPENPQGGSEGNGFDIAASQAAFANTVYPLLRQHCATCHSVLNPQHSAADLATAHTAAMPLVNLRQPQNSRLVERLGIDRHNCWSRDCNNDATQMLARIQNWSNEVSGLLESAPETYSGVLSEAQVRSWIAADRATLSAADRDYFKYISLHELYNRDGWTADDLDHARAGLAKALNSVARHAPNIVLPKDISNVGLVYRIDIREYWGYGLGSPRALEFGGSDEDIFFNRDPALTQDMISRFPRFSFGGRTSTTVNYNPEFARIIWERITKGNYEGMMPAKASPNVRGFHNDYVEAAQLVYTLTRPDVYNAIMYIPGYADQLERQLGLNTSRGVDSFIYATVDDAITLDERIVYRGETRDGFYWKSVDQFSNANFFPFYVDPIPRFVSPFNATQADSNFSFLANIAQDDLDANRNVFAGYKGGLQAQASEIIFSLPNGLQGYAIYGGINQRRTDAFTFIVVDPRRRGSMPPDPNGSTSGTGSRFTFHRERLLNGASCIGCHANGLNRMPNDMRDMLDSNSPKLAHLDSTTRARVRQLYPTTAVLGEIIEADRDIFAIAMEDIKQGMMLGTDKTLYEEPIRKLFETAQRMYNYVNLEGN